VARRIPCLLVPLVFVGGRGFQVANLVIAMHHDHDTDAARAQPPGGLPRQLRGLILGLKLNAKHLGEVLPEGVAGPRLDAPTSGGHEALYGGRVQRPRKLLRRRLVPLQGIASTSIALTFHRVAVALRDPCVVSYPGVVSQPGRSAPSPSRRPLWRPSTRSPGHSPPPKCTPVRFVRSRALSPSGFYHGGRDVHASTTLF